MAEVECRGCGHKLDPTMVEVKLRDGDPRLVIGHCNYEARAEWPGSIRVRVLNLHAWIAWGG